MNLKGKSNEKTFTKKDRLKLDKQVSYQDARNAVRQDKEFMKSIENLPRNQAEEKFTQESLRVSDLMGVNIETIQSKRNAVNCLQGKNSSQRTDMTQSQLSVMNPPYRGAESPYIDSCMRPDLYTRSSCIKRATGTIRVIGKVSYQFRTIYLYYLNGMYDYLDTNGTVTTNGFSSIEHTDLKDLPINEDVDISQDSFLIKYPDPYNPTTDTVGTGINLRCIISTDFDNSGDSFLMSESAMRRFTTLKTKTVNIHLNNKSIKSKYDGKFPPIGELLDEPILFKVCNDTGVVSELVQSAQMATGVEDDTIVVEQNSYVSSIEVFCNNICKDPDVEKLRRELLDFRHKVYDLVAPIVDNFYDKCSDRLRILKENFSHDLFEAGGQECKYPYIRMTINTIDVPTKGQKFSNSYGGKTTCQRVYPDGFIRDELGRNIDMVYPATAIINRTIAGLIWEVFLSSFGDLLQYKVANDLITPERAFEFVQKFMDIIELTKEFNYSKFTPQSLWEYLKIDFMRIIHMPYSNNFTLETGVKLLRLAEEYLDYKKFKIYRGNLETTNAHTVGRLFTFRDMHDTQYGNSSCSTVEKNTKGFASSKDSSKRDGRAFFNKKSVKQDVQHQHISLNILTNEDADIILNGDEGESLYAIKENMEGVGLGINFMYGNDYDESEED